MKAYPISVQLYSVREAAAQDFPATLKKIGDMGYTGVEFAGLHNMTPKDVRAILDDLGMVASSAHGGFPTRETLNELVDTAKTLGHTAHISGFGPKDVETEDALKSAIDRAKEACELFKGTGVRFGLHNHDWEFKVSYKGKTAHQLLLEGAPEVFAEVDTYWVKVGGGDPAEVVRSLGARAPFLHIKDGPLDRTKAMTAIGAGLMDWNAVIPAANEATTEWVIVELDRCDTDMMEAVAASYQYLTQNGFAKGRK